jgi:hypothetical protein
MWIFDNNKNCFVFRLCRFRIDVRVIDETGSVSFTLFDRVAVELFGKSCEDVIQANGLVSRLQFRSYTFAFSFWITSVS